MFDFAQTGENNEYGTGGSEDSIKAKTPDILA
jgi:hypothetical protein